MKNIFSSGFNLPPDCTVSDIDKAAGLEDPYICSICHETTDARDLEGDVEPQGYVCDSCKKGLNDTIVPMPAPDVNTHGIFFNDKTYVVSWRMGLGSPEICDVTTEDGVCIHPTDELLAYAMREIQSGIIEFKANNP